MDELHPAYHCQPKQNWMNDPNGLMQHEGVPICIINTIPSVVNGEIPIGDMPCQRI